jgi:hypothetical protein
MKQSSPVNQRRAFQIHAFVFVATMILLAALNVSLGEPYWIVWPLIGWGIGIIAHWWFVLGPGAPAGN